MAHLSAASCCPFSASLVLVAYWLFSLRWLSKSVSESLLNGVTNIWLRAAPPSDTCCEGVPSLSGFMTSLLRFLGELASICAIAGPARLAR